MFLAVVQLRHERFEFFGTREAGDPDELRDRIFCECIGVGVESERSKRVGDGLSQSFGDGIELESKRVWSLSRSLAALWRRRAGVVEQ